MSFGVQSEAPAELFLQATVLYHSVLRDDDSVHGADCLASNGYVGDVDSAQRA